MGQVIRRFSGPSKRQARRFTPWRGDFLASGILSVLGAWALWRGVSSGKAGSFLIGVGFAAVLLVLARNYWRSGYRRWYGHDLERWAIERIGQLLDRKHVPWRAGEQVPGLGDADLIVEARKGRALVEIKSLQKWSQSVFAGCGPRERAAIAQAALLRERVGAERAYVWLPRGRPTLLQRVFGAGGTGVRVVFGDERVMWRRLR